MTWPKTKYSKCVTAFAPRPDSLFATAKVHAEAEPILFSASRFAKFSIVRLFFPWCLTQSPESKVKSPKSTNYPDTTHTPWRPYPCASRLLTFTFKLLTCSSRLLPRDFPQRLHRPMNQHAHITATHVHDLRDLINGKFFNMFQDDNFSMHLF